MELRHQAIEELQNEAERKAFGEELALKGRSIRTDWDRIRRRSRQIEEDIAPSLLTPEQLVEWREWRSRRFVTSEAMICRMDAVMRLAPEMRADIYGDERIDLLLQKHAGVPLGQAGESTLEQYYLALDIAADSVEQVAYPGTEDAKKRYALAMRRFRDVVRKGEPEH